MFSSSTGYLERYFAQVDALRDQVRREGWGLRLVLAEGDSDDDTWVQMWDHIAAWRHTAHLLQHHHGMPLHRGTGHPDRLANLSVIWNKMLDAVPEDIDMVAIVESDLMWEADVLMALLVRSYLDKDIHCPMVWLDEYFYDIFLYRRNGRKFTNAAPYHPDLVLGQPLELDSAGSCLVMSGHVARAHRTTPEGELMGLCHSAREAGHKVILDSDLSIHQPASEWVGVIPFEGVV
jgi:hypothetical protein